MNEEMKKDNSGETATETRALTAKRSAKVLQYAVTLGAGLVVAFLIVWRWGAEDGIFASTSLAHAYRLLCDGFFVPGVLIMLVGGLIWISREGAFDGVKYVSRYIVYAIIPFSRGKKTEKYAEYKEKKKIQYKERGSFAYMFVCGGILVAVSILFLILYTSVNEA